MTPAAHTARGLSSAEAAQRLASYGKNVLPRAEKSWVKRFAEWFASPIPLMLLAAAGLSYATGKHIDASVILFLFLANYGIRLWHEHKANQAVEKLREHLALFARVYRDGAWARVPASDIVPGDLVALRPGTLIPADAKLENAENFSANESMLTGESLPKEKRTGDAVYASSFVAQGSGEAVVTETGKRTFFGKAVATLDLARKRSALEADIISISKLLSALALLAIALLTAVLYLHGGTLSGIATLDISLLIAGIPVALPTVMSLIISAGVLQLAKGGAIVRRLAALEDLANVNLLLSDKTGTLTENKIHVARVVLLGTAFDEAEALRLAASTTDAAAANPLESAIRAAAKEKELALLPQRRLIPGDSERKRSTAYLERARGSLLATLGAPGAVAALSRFTSAQSALFDKEVRDAAARGDRALLLSARADAREEKELEPVALLFLADRLRADASATVRLMRREGIEVKLLTGDGAPIAREVARALGLAGEVYPRDAFDDPVKLAHILPGAAGFAEVLPRDKYAAVEAGKKYARVAVTGDGANDLPSVSDADVGIAVKGSVDALREAADIVLTTSGLAVIDTAIREARKVFMRLYHYSLYRISESARLIITIAIIGLVLGDYPLTPIQVLLLAFLNDVPIVSIAFDRVKVPRAPASIDVFQRALLSFAFGLGGIVNSVLMLLLAYYWWHLPFAWIQTLFFLKLVVSGHMLIYVAHTERPWFRWLPSWQVIVAVSVTQGLVTLFAYLGFFTAAIPLWLVAFVWVWSFFWMQITELLKSLAQKIAPPPLYAPPFPGASGGLPGAGLAVPAAAPTALPRAPTPHLVSRSFA